MEKNHNDQNKNPKENRPKGNIWVTLIITVAIILLISSIFNMVRGSQYTETTYTDFMDAFTAGELEEVLLRYDRVIYLTKEEAAKPAS